MSINHVLAVAPVADIDTARTWYERLFGRAPDNRPMDSLVEWRVTDTGWLQVWQDGDRAGSALVNFAVDDLASHLDELASRNIDVGEIQTVNKIYSCPSSPTPMATESLSSGTSVSTTDLSGILGLCSLCRDRRLMDATTAEPPPSRPPRAGAYRPAGRRRGPGRSRVARARAGNPAGRLRPGAAAALSPA